MTLGEFLQGRLSDSSPWNCSTLPADWCVALGHPDFAAEWRDVTTPAQCAHFRKLVPLWRTGIGRALPVVRDLQPGDIAVVRAMKLEAGAIWTGEKWAIQGNRKLHFLSADSVNLVRAWRP